MGLGNIIGLRAGGNSIQKVYSGSTQIWPVAGTIASYSSLGYSNPTPSSYSAPLTITKAGIYQGNWESTDETVDAVNVATSEPVIIINSNIRGTGNLIRASVANSNVRVYNTRFYGGALSSKLRRAVVSENLVNLVVENCYLEGTAGIYIAGNYNGNDTTSETVRIRYNKVKNIDGRTSTGRINSQFFQSNTFRKATFVTDADGINHYDGVPNMEIVWNFIWNYAGESDVEDVINIYNSRGTAASPILVQNNYVNGAYKWDWQSEEFTGSGMIADSPGSNKGSCTAYVDFWDNVVVLSNNNDYGVAGGNNIRFRRNVGIGKGYLDDADASRLGLTPKSAQVELRGYPGNIYVHENTLPAGTTHSIEETDHTEGIVGEKSFSVGPLGWRNDGDLWSSAYGVITNRTTLTGDITEAVELSYHDAWLQRRPIGLDIGIAQNNVHYNRTFENNAYLNDFAFSKETSTTYGITLLHEQLRFELRNTDAAVNGGVRAEIAYGSMPQAEMWFRFDATLPSADNAVDTNPESIMQFRPIADAGEDDNRGTVMALQVENGNYRFYTAYSTLATNTTAEGFTWYELGAVTYDSQTKWVLRYKPAIDGTGIIELYKNGSLVVNHLGPNKYNDARQPFWKVGIYKWNWPATSVTTKRVMLVDNIRQGNANTTLAQINS